MKLKLKNYVLICNKNEKMLKIGKKTQKNLVLLAD